VATLVMVIDPFLPERRRRLLAWVSMLGLFGAGAAIVRSSFSPGAAFNGSVLADTFGFYFMSLFLVAAALTILGSVHYLERDDIHDGGFYSLVLLGTVGMFFMATSTELILIFLGLEISSISTYILAGFKRHDALANEASLKYFLLGSFATAFLLYGIAFTYGLTGTTNLQTLTARLGAPEHWPPLVWVALILMFIGLAFKVSVVPFHVWTPDVYQGAPAPVTAFLSVAPKAAAFAVFLRVFLGSLEPAGSASLAVLWISAALTMVVGNLAALLQENVKRMLAYSAIAHAGYVLVGIAAGGRQGTTAVLFYLAVYALMNIGAFILVAHLADRGERAMTFRDFTGLGYERPGAAACLTVFMLSLGGFPTTAGFFAKFYVFRAAVGADLVGLTILAVITSVISIYYYLRLVVVMYMREGEAATASTPLPWALRAVMLVTVAGIFYLGLFPSDFLLLTDLAAIPLPF
jgi:NADH-quinone oxidoreductase subunit N